MREKVSGYSRVVQGRWSTSSILAAEKEVAALLQFRFHRPTAVWFLRSCLHFGSSGYNTSTLAAAIDVSRFLVDLGLLDPKSDEHPPNLRAQIALLLAIRLECALEDGSEQTSDVGTGEGREGRWRLIWRPIRRNTCCSNERAGVVACLAWTCHLLYAQHDKWIRSGLGALERKHARCLRRLALGNLPPVEVLEQSLIEELLPLPAMTLRSPQVPKP